MRNFSILAGVGLLACVPVSKDDSGLSLDPNQVEPADEPADEPSSEPPVEPFEPSVIYFMSQVGVDGIGLTGMDFDGQDSNSVFILVLASEEWDGGTDGNNPEACMLYFEAPGEMAELSDMYNPPTETDGEELPPHSYIGWTFQSATNFMGGDAACADLEGTARYEEIIGADWSFGFGDMSTELETAFQDAVGNDEEWETEYAPYFLSMYVHAEGITEDPSTDADDGPACISLALYYDLTEKDENGNIVVVSETMPAEFDGEAPLETGLYSGNIAFGYYY
ncbi:MAG: hypothetical protein CMK59_00050 [Proteobacteria bacterium]|nr:hypothetical protein [Pseudomonadota bacterium]